MGFDNKIKEEFESKNYSKIVNLVELNIKETKQRLSEQTLQLYLKSLSYYGLYDRAIKYLRCKTPKSYRTSKNYYENLKIIKDKLSKGELSESILLDFYVSFIKTGNLKDAYKIFNSLMNCYPQYFDKFTQVIMLLKCNQICQANEIVNEEEFNGNQLMKIGITYYIIGQYHHAKQTLENARIKRFSKIYDEIYEKLYNLIIKHEKTGKYLSMSYEYFKINHELYRGDIIYVRDVDDYYKSIDSCALKRTYMIWKIEGSKIYAFPVTNMIPKNIRRFKLYRQNYLNFDSDRSVKDVLVTINEKDVQKVQERLTREDYINVLSNIYSGVIVCGDSIKSDQLKEFMEEMYNCFYIKKGNIIVAYKREEKKAKNYLVIDTDDEYIYGIELDVTKNKAVPVDYDIKKINKRKELLRFNDKIKIDDEYIEKANEKVKKK